MKNFIIIMLAAFPLFAQPSERRDLPPVLKKESIPFFKAKDRNAKKEFYFINLKELVKPNTERVALVYFATWCIPCREGMVMLKNSKDSLEKNNTQIVLVNIGEKDVKKVHKWIENYSNSEWDLIMDVNQQLIEKFGLSKTKETELPLTLLLDKNLKPLLLLGTKGNDWPEVLWQEINNKKGESK